VSAHAADSRVVDLTLRAVWAAWSVPIDEIKGRRRTARVVQARKALMLLLHEQGFSYPRIGAVLGRHHSTVIHGVRRMQREAAVSRKVSDRVQTARCVVESAVVARATVCHGCGRPLPAEAIHAAA
jgi:chromosomal replication initiation ATPase DnaA